MQTQISRTKLEQDIHQALKDWHEPNAEPGPLAYLKLFRRLRLEDSSSTREATNKLLFKKLEILGINYELEANLLRKRFLDGVAMHVVANQFNLSEAHAYRKQKQAVKHLALILQRAEIQAREDYENVLESRLEPPSYIKLIGIEEHLNYLLNLLTSPNPPWLVSIEGLGGLGKTSLAVAVSRQVIKESLFDDLGWVSARQHVFNFGGGLRSINSPALTVEDLVEKLVGQLAPDVAKSPTFSFQEGLAALQTRLKQVGHLIIIDNLETVSDIESLLPTLYRLIEPTKFLLTSRKRLHHESGIYHFDLPPLNQSNALHLLRNEAHSRNLHQLKEASDDELRKIYQIAGGNPLALRLVAGQTHVHALDVILRDLAAAQSQKVETLYTYIYRRAWDSLGEQVRQIFLAMPLVVQQGGSLDYLVEISGQKPGSVQDALDQLVALNLVDSQGNLTERRYSIHNLTRTFLQEQVAKWQ